MVLFFIQIKIISKLTDKFNIVEDVKKDVEDIKNYVFNKKLIFFKYRFPFLHLI
ncbi:BhlA/UviB family holin-like peptide [Clostridium tepidiprofundi]|uniref:BhlA/UviB family holin-like peptide n=1 Tax=Clostridium tepidiprofundi TaxID=420412 RepID=UPI000A026506